MFKKIFQNAKDKNVKGLIVYADTTDGKLYLEPAHTNQAKQADVKDAFEKGMLVIYSSDYTVYKPISMYNNKVSVATAAESSDTVTLTGAIFEALAPAVG